MAGRTGCFYVIAHSVLLISRRGKVSSQWPKIGSSVSVISAAKNCSSVSADPGVKISSSQVSPFSSQYSWVMPPSRRFSFRYFFAGPTASSSVRSRRVIQISQG